MSKKRKKNSEDPYRERRLEIEEARIRSGTAEFWSSQETDTLANSLAEQLRDAVSASLPKGTTEEVRERFSRAFDANMLTITPIVKALVMRMAESRARLETSILENLWDYLPRFSRTEFVDFVRRAERSAIESALDDFPGLIHCVAALVVDSLRIYSDDVLRGMKTIESCKQGGREKNKDAGKKTRLYREAFMAKRREHPDTRISPTRIAEFVVEDLERAAIQSIRETESVPEEAVKRFEALRRDNRALHLPWRKAWKQIQKESQEKHDKKLPKEHGGKPRKEPAKGSVIEALGEFLGVVPRVETILRHTEDLHS